MKITAIKQQVKRHDRYSIYIDGKYSFSLSELELINSGLRVNQEINTKEVAKLKDQSQEGKMFDRTLNLLSIRPRSEWEIVNYLERKKQAPALIENILSRLSNLGYINDRKFAELWVDNRRRLKPTSSLKLRSELKQKHISSEIIDEVLSQKQDDHSALKEMLERKRLRYPDKIKLMQHLARQGFRYDDIKRALEE